MADWDRLLDELHDRDMRLVMDLVVNHTSHEHEWFVASRTEPAGEYGDYYVWKDGDPATDATDSPGPAGREPPNNWEAAFGGPAWEWDEGREQYYLHLFLPEQPDLDWENPEVREAVFEMMNWWFEKGIDGFRMDVINLLSKPQSFPDGDPDEEWVGIEHFSRGPRLREYLDAVAEHTLDGRDVMTVGEMAAVDLADAREYVGPDGPLDMVFHFDHMQLDYGDGGWWDVVEWELTDLKRVVARWQTELGDGWNAVYLGNHDQPRIVSRFGGDGEYRHESATLLATFLLTLRGTPFVFQGDEIGMTNYPWTSLDEQEDAQTVGRVREAMQAGEVDDFDEVRELVRERSRDNARTPMQWDASEHAGFTTGDPWLPVNPNYETVNVVADRAVERGEAADGASGGAASRAGDRSVFEHYRRLIDLRNDEDTLVYGEFELLLPDHEEVFAYTRTLADDTLVVVLNWDGTARTVDLPGLDGDADPLVCNYADAPDPAGGLDLRPYEAVVFRR
jgi:oligo-1,6-glucosidase/alpha-glucosidase